MNGFRTRNNALYIWTLNLNTTRFWDQRTVYFVRRVWYTTRMIQAAPQAKKKVKLLKRYNPEWYKQRRRRENFEKLQIIMIQEKPIMIQERKKSEKFNGFQQNDTIILVVRDCTNTSIQRFPDIQNINSTTYWRSTYHCIIVFTIRRRRRPANFAFLVNRMLRDMNRFCQLLQKALKSRKLGKEKYLLFSKRKSEKNGSRSSEIGPFEILGFVYVH